MSVPTIPLSSVLGVDSGSAKVGFKQPGTGAVARTVQDKLREAWISVKDFGAVGNGSSDDSAAVQAAINTAASSGGGVVFFPKGVYAVSGLTVSTNGIALVGENIYSPRLRFSSPTGTMLTVAGAFCRLENFEIETPGVSHTSGAIVDIQGTQGRVSGIRITGNFWDCFKLEKDGKGAWFFDNIRVSGGYTLNSLIRIKGTAQTVADNHVTNVLIANTATWGEAAIVLDAWTDTFRVTGGTLSGIGKIVVVRNSAGAGQDPRYIRFDGVHVESDTDDAVTVTAGNDISYLNGYIALSKNAFVVSGGRDIRIKNNHIIVIDRCALDLNGGSRVSFEGNTVLDCSQESNLSYSSIDVASGVSDWVVRDNLFGLRPSTVSKPNRQLTIAVGASDRFIVGGNLWGESGVAYGTQGDQAVSNGATGTNTIIGASI